VDQIAIFVYGTLMQGQRAHHLMGNAQYLGKAQLKDFAMYHLGRYPGIIPCPGEVTFGEVYLISKEMLTQMDRYEEEGDLYLRRTVNLQLEDRTIQAQAYIYNRAVSGCRLLRQIWNDNL
jgi:gamma-glutamylcyclotransferase (GGCT)/AIG2-like uncharacterized protein YtfP